MADEKRVLTAKVPQDAAGGKAIPADIINVYNEVIRAIRRQDYQNAEALLTDAIKDKPDSADLKGLLAQVMILQNRWVDAENILDGLIREGKKDNDLYSLMGQVYYAEGRYQEAVRIMKKADWNGKYPPFYNNTLGDSLQKLGRKKEAMEVFRRDLQQYRATGEFVSPYMLDGTFQNVLNLDIEQGEEIFEHDLELYKKFLSEITIDQQEANYLASTIVMMSMHLNQRWFRPRFRGFVEHIEGKGYLADENLNQMAVLPTAHLALESWEYHEDRKVESILETFLSYYQPEPEDNQDDEAFDFDEATAKLKNAGVDAGTVDSDNAAKISQAEREDSLTYQWYMCRYYPDHWSTFDYIQERYPYTAVKIQPFLNRFSREPAAKIEEEIVDRLMACIKDISRDELIEGLEKGYERAVGEEKLPVYLSREGEPYRNGGRKIMPNDPCPCGSGKKYKKCCGRY